MNLSGYKCGPYNVHIRWMIRRDMNDVLDMERHCFAEPWSEDEFVRYLRSRDHIGMVAEIPEKQVLVGYMAYDLQKSNIEVDTFGVHHQYRRLGVGSAMIDKLIRKLRPQNRRRLTFPVSEANLDAQLWLKARGFRCVSVCRDYWDRNPNDLAAYIFQYRVSAQVADEKESRRV